MDEQNTQPMVPYTKIRYVSMGDLTIYFVSEDDLRFLESGSPSSTYLNLGIFFISIGISFLTSLLVNVPISIYVFTVFTIVTVGSLTAGLVLFTLWRRSSKDAKSVIQRIRARAVTPAGNTIREESVDQ